MRNAMRPLTLAAITLWTFLAGPVLQSPGQWGTSCVSPVRAAQPEVIHPVEHVELNGKPAGTWRYGKGGYIYRRDAKGDMLGAYDPDRKLWFPLIDGKYNEADAISYQMKGQQDSQNKGLDPGWVKHLETRHKDEIYIGGKPVSMKQAQAMIGTNVPPYSRQASFTVVTKDEKLRDLIVKDFLNSPELKEFQGRAIVRAYDPDHWHLDPFSLDQNAEFVTKGYAMLVQGPPDADGRAKPQMMTDYPGPKKLAAVLATLREPGPNYDPAKIDKIPLSIPVVGGLPWGMLIVGGVCLFLIYHLSKRK